MAGGRRLFLGRIREFSLLLDRLRETAAGLAGCALVTGERGIGKTALLSAFAEAAQREGLERALAELTRLRRLTRIELDIPIHFTPDPSNEISFSILFSPAPTATPTITLTPTPKPTRTSTPTREPSRTPTQVPSDTQSPPSPSIIGPKGGQLSECLNDIVLRWNAVTDASGIDVYQVRLSVSYDNGATWNPAGTFEVSSGTSLNVNPQTDCGNLYRWRVRARDSAGNFGSYSSFATFGIALP